MMQFSVTTEGKSFAETFKLMQAFNPKQFEYATAVAINKVAEDVKFVLTREMTRVFDRPTQYTLNSLFIRYAKKDNPVAYVSFKNAGSSNAGSAGQYLLAEVYGGGRAEKRSEKTLANLGFKGGDQFYLTPASGAKLDSNGNVPRRKYEEIIAFFKANSGHDFTSTSKTSSRIANKVNLGLGAAYFIALPNDARVQSKRLSAGIYERKGLSFTKVFNITRKPIYKSVFKFFDIGQEVARDQFAKRFLEAFDMAIRTAR